jgi:hypothetical protein
MGAEIPLNAKLTMGGEFTHTDYSSMNLTHHTIQYDIKPHQNTFMLRLKYKICGVRGL